MKKTPYSILFLLIFLPMMAINTPVFAQDEAYKIGPGDSLEISIWKDEYLTRQLVVPPDGIIAFPLIGDIKVTNLTVAGLKSIVAKKIKEYIPDATVTVMLLEARSLTASVVGKVHTPGRYPINEDTTVMHILALAGGLTEFAASDDILIIRNENGKLIKILFDYDDVKKGKRLEQNIFLKRGDVVVVP